jgi:hypothetical protein
MENPADSSAIGFPRLYCANAGLSQRHGVQAQRKGNSGQADNQNPFPSHDWLNLTPPSVRVIEHRYCAELHNRA